MNDYEMCIEKLKQVNLSLAYGHANIAKNDSSHFSDKSSCTTL
jgi:hypothetical protein